MDFAFGFFDGFIVGVLAASAIGLKLLWHKGKLHICWWQRSSK
jgi:hypothetical protein